MSRSENRCFLVSKDVVIPLTAHTAIVIGRDATTCNFVLRDDRVSRVHSMVFHRDRQYLVKDLNSSNGTYLNGRRVTGEIVLNPGDIIELRPFSFEFVRPEYAQLFDELTDDGTEDTTDKSKIAGSLRTLSVSDVIQLLNSTLQSGVLAVNDDAGRTANLIFLDGEVVQAAFDNRTGEEAVFSLMRVKDGQFEFTKTEPLATDQRVRSQPAATGLNVPKAQTVSFEKQVIRRTQSLLLEGTRLMDEAPPTT